MTPERSYIGYLGFLFIDFLKSVLMYSKGAICLSRLFFKMGLFTVHPPPPPTTPIACAAPPGDIYDLKRKSAKSSSFEENPRKCDIFFSSPMQLPVAL